MQQSKLSSLAEACINTAIGFAINLALAPIVYPLFGHAFTLSQNIGLTLVFTVVSVLRGYAVRRWFNARIKSLAARLIAKSQTTGGAQP